MTLTLLRTTASKQYELDAIKSDAKKAIDALAGEVRCSYITPIPGQEMTYQAKETEARLYISAPIEPVDMAPYPFIFEEIGTTGETAYQVATIILYMADLWRVIGPQIEGLRVKGKAAVDAADTNSAAKLALENIRLDLEELL